MHQPHPTFSSRVHVARLRLNGTDAANIKSRGYAGVPAHYCSHAFVQRDLFQYFIFYLIINYCWWPRFHAFVSEINFELVTISAMHIKLDSKIIFVYNKSNDFFFYKQEHIFSYFGATTNNGYLWISVNFQRAHVVQLNEVVKFTCQLSWESGAAPLAG